jgi:flagellin-like hook-associated protein FlgL
MAILPISLARVSERLRTSVTLSQMTQTQQQLLDVENQISTGKRVNSPSDDPGAAAVIQQLQKTLEQRSGYATNLQNATSQLSEVDSTLGNLTGLLQQAQTIASQNVGTDVTASQRQSAAAVVQTLIDQAMSIGNTEFEGSYIFGGDRSTTAPFVDNNGRITFVGTGAVLQNSVDENLSLQININGAQVFNALSGKAAGANLSPSTLPTTRLVDLGGATNDGITPGSIKVSDGTTTAIVDLSHADNLGDVAAAINAVGFAGVSASVGSNGLVLSGPGNISVNEVGGGTTAADLGILTPTGAGAGVTIIGSNVNTKVTPLTPLSSLRSGAGIDPAGITINNGGTAVSISFAGLNTVQDVINAINGSKAGVTAQVNAAGTGIDIVNPTQGTSMSITENGGTSAADLGLLTTTGSTQLAGLNGGNGIHLASGPDMQVTRMDGTTFSVDLDGADTVQDVINAINTADGGGGVTASLDPATNGIKLTDATGGGGTLAVASLNGSTTVADLGLSNAAASGNTLTGADVNPVQSTGLFGDLQKLRDSLQKNDTQGITAAAQLVQADYDRVSVARGTNGARLKDFQSRQTQLADENVATQSFLSDLQDTDFTTAITKFQTLQTALQANYATTSKLMSMSLMDFLH